MSECFFDIHHHILCGMDDGARDEDMMLAMLRRAAQDGIGQIAATIHIEPGIRPFPRQVYDQALESAQAYCREAKLPLILHEGAELLYTRLTPKLLQDGAVPPLAGTDRVLVEFSPEITVKEFYRALEQILSAGFLPIAAHVERYRALVVRPGEAIAIRRELPVFYQVNCSAMLEPHGLRQRYFFHKLLDEGCVDAAATDAHNLTSRPVRMRKAYEWLSAHYGKAYAAELTSGQVLGLSDAAAR